MIFRENALSDGRLKNVHVPRNNVVFELGACMARLGTKKVFMLVPEEPVVKIPSYFRESRLIHYSNKTGDSLDIVINSINDQIIHALSMVEGDLFHSDLPALGLVQSYFYNFVRPVYQTIDQNQSVLFEDENNLPWNPESGFTLTIAIPKKLMDRRSVDSLCKDVFNTENVTIQLRDGRDISVYALPRSSKEASLEIIDVPTTLLTSEEVINQVDNFWRTQDEERQLEKNPEFRNALAQREIATFRRRMSAILDESGLNKRFGLNRIQVLDLSHLQKRLSG